MLSSGSSTQQRKFSIILPVYSDPISLESLLRSIEGVISSSDCKAVEELIVVNDNPEAADISQVLAKWKGSSSIPLQVYRNSANLGFVRTINKGIAAANPKNDILIINSDTVIYPRCFENFERAVINFNARGIRWASLTPFSNNSTITTIPEMCHEHNSFPCQASPKNLAALVHELFSPELDSNYSLPVIPVGIGFCMLMSRNALDEIGIFSEEFSPGYGEETDWCLRASKAGFKNFLLPDVFVYHEGGKSFSSKKQALLDRGAAIISAKYPTYNTLISEFTADSENHFRHRQIQPYYRFLTLLKHKKAILFILHFDITKTVGGLEKYVKEATRFLQGRGRSVIWVSPDLESQRKRYLVRVDDEVFGIYSMQPLLLLLQNLTRWNLMELETVSLQHSMYWKTPELITFLENIIPLATNSNFVLHDYFSICSHHNLLWNDEKYCGAPVDPQLGLCNSCNFGKTVTEHREVANSILRQVSTIVVPSEVAHGIFSSIFPHLQPRTRVVPHYLLTGDQEPISPVSGRISLIFLGAPSYQKGILRFQKLVDEFSGRFDFVTIARADHFKDPSLVRHIGHEGLTGPQLRYTLESLQPGFVFLGSLTPETFSYALYESLDAGLAILSTTESGNIAKVLARLQPETLFSTFDELQKFLRQDNESLLSIHRRISKRWPSVLNIRGLESVFLQPSVHVDAQETSPLALTVHG